MSDQVSNKRTFEVTVDGKVIKLAAVRPNQRVQNEANMVYGKAFREAVTGGLIVRAKIEEVLREQKLWDDEKQARFDELTANILKNELLLAKGGISLKQAREIAIEMRKERLERQLMMSQRNQLDHNTAESMAQNKQFNYYVSACTVYADTGKSYFKDFDDYLNRDSDIVGIYAAQEMGKLLYNLDDDFEKKLPENEFLLKYKFVNEDLHLVNKEGKLIDVEGRLVNENGNLINSEGQLIDEHGNLLNEDGSYKVDFVPFLDDDGNPVVVETETSEQEKVEEVTPTPSSAEPEATAV